MKSALKKLWNKPKKLFKAKVPSLQDYVGETVLINGVGEVVIGTIVGNLTTPQFYEINGEHLIGMLRFHAQMEGDTSITEQQFIDFECMELDAEKLPVEPKKRLAGELM